MLQKTSAAKIKLLMSLLLAASLPLFLFCVGCLAESGKSLDAEGAAAQTSTDDFYAYYTRLDYDIPVQDVMGHIQRADDYDDEFEEEEEDEEQRWEPSDPITGKYADIVVNVGKAGQFIFSRQSSYLPYWKTKKGKWFVDELLERQKDVACLYSYIRIIENTPDKILIHWRYMPDLAKVKPADVVHESFAISPDGTVSRKVKKATGWIDEWKVTKQKLKLNPNGIRKVLLEPEHLVKESDPPIQGARVKDVTSGEPIAWLRFDEGLTGCDYYTKDAISGNRCVIEGNKRLFKKGVSGSALAFDGYHSKVTLPSPESPDYLRNKLTLEAWVALGAFPWRNSSKGLFPWP
jgi:hypothetical protein